MRIFNKITCRRAIFAGVSSFALIVTVGCQTNVGSKTTPVSTSLDSGSIQYAAPKFKLSKAAEELEAAKDAKTDAKSDIKPNTAPTYQVKNQTPK